MKGKDRTEKCLPKRIQAVLCIITFIIENRIDENDQHEAMKSLLWVQIFKLWAEVLG